METGYAIKRAVDRSTRFFLAASLAQVYPELAALEEDEYVVSTDEPRGARPRETYRLTDKGQSALNDCSSASASPISSSATKDFSASSSPTRSRQRTPSR